MKRKGFTLIELLAVIVILAIIALIAIPIIMNIVEKANKSAFQDSGYGIMKAGELYYSKHSLKTEGMIEDVEFKFPNELKDLEIKGSKPTSGNMIVSKEGKIALAISNGKYCIRKGYDEEDIKIDEDIETCKTKEIANPVSAESIELQPTEIRMYEGDEKSIVATVLPEDTSNKNLKWTSLDESVATVSNGKVVGIKGGKTKIYAETVDGSKIKKEVDITVVGEVMSSTDACINKTTACPNGTKVVVKVNDEESYNFYVIKDDIKTNSLTLIMDRNLGSNVAWITNQDYVAAGNFNWDFNRGYYGPITALNALEDRTKGWINIEPITYKIMSLTRTNVRARMMSSGELTPLLLPGNIVPSYLFENTSNVKRYWYSDPYYYLQKNNYAKVSPIAGNENISMLFYDVYNTSNMSVRPVILIKKNIK